MDTLVYTGQDIVDFILKENRVDEYNSIRAWSNDEEIDIDTLSIVVYNDSTQTKFEHIPIEKQIELCEEYFKKVFCVKKNNNSSTSKI